MSDTGTTALQPTESKPVDGVVQPSQIAPSENARIAFEHQGRWGRLGATGLYAGAAATASVLIGLLTFGSPTTNPSHFLLSSVACFIAGMFTQAVSNHGRMMDAKDERRRLADEVRRLADAKRSLEERFLESRLSSDPKKKPTK